MHTDVEGLPSGSGPGGARIITAADMLRLPDDLPRPVDDGACDHLPGTMLPSQFIAQINEKTGPRPAAPKGFVLFFYPMTGRPGETLPTGWSDFPGARGCTPEACGFRSLKEEIARLGYTVLGISNQSPEAQGEAATRLELNYPLISDFDLTITTALRLPTFQIDDRRFIRRLTLITSGGFIIDRVFYPVFPPDKHAEEVLDHLHNKLSGS